MQHFGCNRDSRKAVCVYAQDTPAQSADANCQLKRTSACRRSIKASKIHRQNTMLFNPLTPNDLYMSRTAPLTSKRCILYIYSTNIGTEYFKHALYSPFFSLQNAVCFIMLTCLVPDYSHFIHRVC